MYIASRLAQLSANLLSILIIVSLFYSFFFFKALRWRSNVEDDSRWRWGRWKTIGARSAWTRTKGEWKWAIPAKSNLLHPTHISLACSTGFTFEQSLLVCYIVSLFPVVLVHFFFFLFFQLFGTQRKRERRVRMCGSYIRALLARKTKEHPLYSTFQLLHPRCAIKNRPFTFTDVCNTAAE